jgi:sugar lactone lactonase YvrE
MTVDAEGFLWVALWQGWTVNRYAPDGRFDLSIRLPVALVTSCAFGGPDLTDLYITTARSGLTEADSEAQPLAGGLFRCRPGFRGLPPSLFGG